MNTFPLLAYVKEIATTEYFTAKSHYRQSSYVTHSETYVFRLLARSLRCDHCKKHYFSHYIVMTVSTSLAGNKHCRELSTKIKLPVAGGAV